MELRQLEYFAAVARYGQFTRAASELWITQSALSQQVRRLEAEVGVALLRRTPRGAELTAAGEALLAHAETALAAVARARAELDRHAGAERGQVRVAATAVDAAGLPLALAAFHRRHPEIQVALRHVAVEEAVALVQRRAVDVAMVALRGEPPADTRSIALAPEPLRAMLAPEDPLAGGTVAVADLAGRPFVLAEPQAALRATVVDACQAAGFSPVPLFEVSDPATVRVLVGAGLGVALVPASWLREPGPAVGAATLTGRAPVHRVTLLAPPADVSPAGGLLLEALRSEDGGEL